jgi:hypothetical protein
MSELEKPDPLDGLSASQLELVLQNLHAEKSRRYSGKLAKGEIVVRRVIVREGEQPPLPERGEFLTRRIIVRPPPHDPSKEWYGQQVDPEAVAKRGAAELEPDQMGAKTYVWISVRHAHPEGEHGG